MKRSALAVSVGDRRSATASGGRGGGAGDATPHASKHAHTGQLLSPDLTLYLSGGVFPARSHPFTPFLLLLPPRVFPPFRRDLGRLPRLRWEEK